MTEAFIQQILLCGFMGCGKTSVGQALAFRMKWKFMDTDALVEKREGKSIPELFAQNGEAYFRQAETQVAAHLNKQKYAVISTGGGFLTKAENLKLVLDDSNLSAIVYLKCDFETCYARIIDSNRPLVLSKSKRELEELFEERTRQYQAAATFSISNHGLVADAVEEILRKVVVR